MTLACNGYAKLAEELGELQQVIGKRLAYWTTDKHPDGTNLTTRLIEEIGDVLAALDFVAGDMTREERRLIQERRSSKLDLFEAWHRDPTNNLHSIERTT